VPLKCFLLDLKDDPALIEAYCDWHKPGGPPKAVIDSIRQSGVQEMQIFRTGNRLCMVVEADASFDAESKRASEAANPEAVGWEQKMDVYQLPLRWAKPGEKWVEAEQIFALTAQP
jgi:L-rhamnose mutarotase